MIYGSETMVIATCTNRDVTVSKGEHVLLVSVVSLQELVITIVYYNLLILWFSYSIVASVLDPFSPGDVLNRLLQIK